MAIGLQLLAKLVLLHAAIGVVPWWTFAAIAMLARIGPLAWTLLLPPLHQGLASRFRAGLRGRHLALWSAAGAIVIALAPALAVAGLVIPLWAWWLAARIGGISGDGHGAGIELIETALLAALVAAR